MAPIATLTAGFAIDKLLDLGMDALQAARKQALRDDVRIDLSETRTSAIEHVALVRTWSSSISLRALSTQKSLKRNFVQLSLDVGLIRHSPVETGKKERARSLDRVFSGKGHCAILGRPGAGKTTSLQRIAQLALARWEQGKGGAPILVRLRDLRDGEDLLSHLISILGIVTRFPSSMKEWERSSWRQRALIRYLSAAESVLLVDGLDETPLGVRPEVESQLIDLALRGRGCRIFVTCRTAEYHRDIAEMQSYTIQPLSADKVLLFAKRWLGARRAPKFVADVKKNPYAGSEVVPLTLAHLCAIYDREGNLPERPIDVYEQIVSLLIDEWDRQRGVVRRSRYRDFSAKKKERFLQAIAYHLSLRGRRGSFSLDDVEAAYQEIYRHFSLPRTDAADVVSEIESHTGLLVESGYRRYDFVHLVIQEFLTAMHAHTTPNAVEELVPRFPNEMALVTAYSGDPGAYLERILERLLHVFGDRSSGHDEAVLRTFLLVFLSRSGTERPIVVPTARIGWVLLAFVSLLAAGTSKDGGPEAVPPDVATFLHDSGVSASTRLACTEATLRGFTTRIDVCPDTKSTLPQFLREYLNSRRRDSLSFPLLPAPILNRLGLDRTDV